MTRLLLFLAFTLILGCSKDPITNPEPNDNSQLYFPPVNSNNWEGLSLTSLNWDEAAVNDLYDFLSAKNTRAFILLKDGKIVLEKYWGKNIINTHDFDQNTNWYWASAGKSITAFLVGLAQEEGLLNINDKTSNYLGENWTSLPLEKENLITVQHQLTMTTGLDYRVEDIHCTDSDCLQYKADAGTQWFYHNAPYTLLEKVVSSASGISYNQFTDNKLEQKIGMNGNWIKSGYNNVYWSSARDAARFGLLVLNKARWDGESIMTDEQYHQAMVNTSQELNPSYGYLWWLNGKESIIFPGLATSFNRPLSTNAPADLFVAAGKNGQFIDVIPSENIVVVRMGEAPDNSLVPIQFHDEMWGKIMKVVAN